MAKLAGRTALITGASSGIGRGVAEAFAAEGARVVVNYPDASQAENAAEVVDRIGAFGGVAHAIEADVAAPDQVAGMIAELEGHFGPADILVNNAGIAHTAPLQDIEIETWDHLLAVHLRGTFLVTRGVLPGMIAARGGKIINTASQLAYKGAPGLTHYTAAKGAIISLTRSLALEVSPYGIQVNSVAPGATATPILDGVPDDLLDAVRQAIPLGRIADVADIVPTFVFLASDESRHYQGQCLSPNGGDVFL